MNCNFEKDLVFNKKVLLIDTEKNVLLTYQAVLQEEGYQVEIAMDEGSAWGKISGETFAVVIAELYLRGQKTVNLLKKIKETHPEIYIIMITATFLNPEGCEEVIDAGVDDYFTKPFSPNSLLANIKKGLRRRDLVLKNIQLEENLTNISPADLTDYAFTKAGNVCNNHFFNLKLQNEITRAERYNHPFSLVVFEINVPDKDHNFDSLDKQKISEQLFHVLPKITRRTDVITQTNGTFALILVETSTDGVKNFSSRLQNEIVKLNIGENIHMPPELSEYLTIKYHSFPEQSDYIQQWSTTQIKITG